MQVKLAVILYLISVLLLQSSCQDAFIDEFAQSSGRIEIPRSNFRCEDHKWPGYYADVETDCQVFHICVDRITRLDKFSFFCPDGTIFNQELLVCVWPMDFDCQSSPSFYRINELLYSDQYEETSRESRRFDQGKVLDGDAIDFHSNDLQSHDPNTIVIGNQINHAQVSKEPNKPYTSNEYRVQDKGEWINAKRNKPIGSKRWPIPPENIKVDVNLETLDPIDESKEYILHDKMDWLNSQRIKPISSKRWKSKPETIPLDINVKTLEPPLKDNNEFFLQNTQDYLKSKRTKTFNLSNPPEIFPLDINVKTLEPPNEDKEYLIVDKQELLDSPKNKPTDPSSRNKNSSKNKSPFRSSKSKFPSPKNNLNSQGPSTSTPENVKINEVPFPALPDLRENINIDLDKFHQGQNKKKPKNPIHNTNNNFFLISDKPEQIIITLNDQQNPFHRVKGQSHTDNLFDESAKPGTFSHLQHKNEDFDEVNSLVGLNDDERIILNLDENNKLPDRTPTFGPNQVTAEHLESLSEDFDLTDEELSALSRFASINSQISDLQPADNLNNIDRQDQEFFVNNQRRNLILNDFDLDFAEPENVIIEPHILSSLTGSSDQRQGTKVIRNERGESTSRPIVHSFTFDNVLPNFITQGLQQNLPVGLGLSSTTSGNTKPKLKSPFVIVSTVEAEDNEQNQEKVYINTILSDDFNLNLKPPPIKPVHREPEDQKHLLYSLPNGFDYSKEERRDRFKDAIDSNDIDDEILRVQNFEFLKKFIAK